MCQVAGADARCRCRFPGAFTWKAVQLPGSQGFGDAITGVDEFLHLSDGPAVVNGDGDRTGFNEVETGTDQYEADVPGTMAFISGYVSPTAPATSAPAGSAG